jgi:hypothetical protein
MQHGAEHKDKSTGVDTIKGEKGMGERHIRVAMASHNSYGN